MLCSVLPYEHLHGDHSIRYLPQGFLLDFWALKRTICTNFPSLLFYVLSPSSCPCGNLLSTHVDFPATSCGGWLTEKVEKNVVWWNLRWVAAQKYRLLMGIWCQATVPADIDVAPIPTLPPSTISSQYSSVYRWRLIHILHPWRWKQHIPQKCQQHHPWQRRISNKV